MHPATYPAPPAPVGDPISADTPAAVAAVAAAALALLVEPVGDKSSEGGADSSDLAAAVSKGV